MLGTPILTFEFKTGKVFLSVELSTFTTVCKITPLLFPISKAIYFETSSESLTSLSSFQEMLKGTSFESSVSLPSEST